MTSSDPVLRLVDLESIRTLQARYWRLMDLKEWSALEDLFSSDAAIQVPTGPTVDGVTPMGGAEGGGKNVVRHIREVAEDAITIHQGYAPEITWDDPARAHAIWPMESRVIWPGDRPRNGITQMHGWGHYHNVYRKVEEIWYIELVQLRRLHFESQ